MEGCDMAIQAGVSLYFRDNRIHIRRKTIYDLGKPKYVHLLINEREKQMFIQSCEKDKDAFCLNYSAVDDDAERCYVNAKALLQYLASVIGVAYPSDSLWFAGTMLDDGKTVFIDMSSYQTIPYDGARE